MESYQESTYNLPCPTSQAPKNTKAEETKVFHTLHLHHMEPLESEGSENAIFQFSAAMPAVHFTSYLSSLLPTVNFDSSICVSGRFCFCFCIAQLGLRTTVYVSTQFTIRHSSLHSSAPSHRPPPPSLL